VRKDRVGLIVFGCLDHLAHNNGENLEAISEIDSKPSSSSDFQKILKPR
jgi:hypothetical protein